MPKSDKKLNMNMTGPVARISKQVAPSRPPAKKVVPSREVEDLDDVNTCTADHTPVMLVPAVIDVMLEDKNAKDSQIIEELFEESGAPSYEKSDFNQDVPMLGVGCEVEVMTSPTVPLNQMMSKLDPFMSYEIIDRGGGHPPPFGCQYYGQDGYYTDSDTQLGQQQVCQEDAFELNNGNVGVVGELVKTLEKVCPSILDQAMETNPYEGVEILDETNKHCDEGFDSEMTDPKDSDAISPPRMAGKKRSHEDEAECHIPLVVGDFDPPDEDTEAAEEAVAALIEESPYNRNVTFRNKGRAVAISCSPETTGQDLKQIAKLHGVLDELGVVNEIMLMTPTGRHVGDTDLVTANMELNVIELPSTQKKRKVDPRTKRR